jgi:hypothetical protein
MVRYWNPRNKLPQVRRKTQSSGNHDGDAGEILARCHREVEKADFFHREKLNNLLVNAVSLYPDRALVYGNTPNPRGNILIP